MPPPMRHCPADFAEMSKLMLTRALCEHYVAGPSQISRWRRETGLGGYGTGGLPARKLPDGFRLHAATESNAALAARYSCSVSMIGRWRREAGIASTFLSHPTGPRAAKRPIPHDFAQMAAAHGTKRLGQIYKASDETIRRWRKATGAYYVKPASQPRESRPPRRKAVDFQRQAPSRRSPVVWKGPPAKPMPPRDTTLEGQAADVLRAYGPVYRCNEIGRPDCADDRKQFWRYGNVVLTPDELLQRAAAKGWRAAA